ncbi:MAG TPA: MFS transporter [Kutzneria sp.]|nr:MFS transporter [Kutzneria sp.]
MNRDFRRLWLGETTSAFGSSVTSVAFPLIAAVTLHADTFVVGLLAAVAWVPWLLIGLPAGAWVDRLPRRAVMLTCDFVLALLYLSIPVAEFFDFLTIAQLVVVAALTGVATVFFTVAYRTYLPALVDKADLVPANARMQAGQSAAQVLGPGASGLIAQFLGVVTGLLLDAVSFVVSAVCLLTIRTREPRVARTERTPLRTQIADGLRFVAGDRILLPFTIYGAVSNLALIGYQAIESVFLLREVGADPALIGGLLMVGSVGGLIGSMLAAPIARRIGQARAVLACQLCAVTFGLLLPLTGPGAGLLFFAVGSFVLVAGIVASNVVFSGWRQGYCPPHLLGRVSASSAVLSTSMMALGGLLGGVLGSAVGTRATMWVMVVLLALSTGILLASPIRGRRDFPSAADAHLPQPRHEPGRAVDRDDRTEVQVVQTVGADHQAGVR